MTAPAVASSTKVYWQHASWAHEKLTLDDVPAPMQSDARAWFAAAGVTPGTLAGFWLTYSGTYGQPVMTEVHIAGPGETVTIDVGTEWPSLPWIMAALSRRARRTE